MRKAKIIFCAALVILASVFTSCQKDSGTEPETGTSGGTTTDGGSGTNNATGVTVAAALAKNCTSHEKAGDYTWDSSNVIPITFNGTTVTSGGSTAAVNGSKVTIAAGGTYSLSGTLNDGQVIVNSSDTAVVKLILNGVNIANSSNAPIFIKASAKTVIILAANTENYLTDASSYIYDNASDDEPNAALFSKSDLSICGTGSLNVNGKYNDAIASKDGLIIINGNINITSVDDGIRGKDYLIVKGGTITVKSAGDALKSDNDADSTRGYIYIATGTLNLTASAGDGITAETDVLISDGVITLTTGGGSNYTASSNSTKGVKGLVSTIIDGGTFNINSSDDALHSNKDLVINSGTFTISSGDDGIHADATLHIYSGTINITKCYEGIESAYLLINSGNIHIVSSDDGINGAGGKDSSSPGSFVTTGNYYLYIYGGYIVVNAAGDGIDVNGSIVMAGGTVIVNGPTNDGNGAIDYDVSFKITGGTLIAAGSAGMAQAPGGASTQYSVLINLRSSLSANTVFHIQASDGTEVLTFKPSKYYQSVAFSSSALTNGKTYDIYYGGSSTGTCTDGLYSGGTYSGGTKYSSFTVSGVSTKVQN